MNRTRSWVRSLSIALACSALACALRLLIDPVLGTGLPYAFALGGVALSVYLAGWQASIVNVLVSAAWVNYLFITPRYEYSSYNLALFSGLLSYLVIAGALIFLGARASAAVERERSAREEMQRALDTADRANVAWRTADQQKDQFISVLSHELRNPLGAISNAAAYLHHKCAGCELAPAVQLLHRQVEQMRRLLDDLLDVSRITRGLLDLQRVRQDLRQCVQNAVEANAHLVEDAQQTLEVVFPNDAVMAHVDGARITQIVSNLVNNAAKYAGRKAHIEVRLEQSPESLVICVRDNGVGIQPELLPHLFEQFNADTRATGAQGLGLGLWISQSLAAMHGGHIVAKSEGPGRGAEFRVHLPVTN